MFCSLLAPIYLHLLSTTSLQNPSQLNITLLFCRLHPIDYRSFFFCSSPLLFFFYPSCRPPSSSKWCFLLSLLFIFIPTSVFSSSWNFSVRTHLFLSCCCNSFLFCSLHRLSWSYYFFPFVPSSVFPSLKLLFFYHVCSSLIPAVFVPSSSSSFSTDLIVLFISSSAFIFFLLIRRFFCCVMWNFHSLYTFFCSALTTPLLSCHHFSVMSPLLLPHLSCCVILRSHKQTFPPRLPCTDLSEWSQETITSRATRVLVLSDHQRSWRHALIVLDKTMELLVLRYTLSHVIGSSSIVEVGAQRLRSYRVQ